MTLTREEILELQAQSCPCCGDEIDDNGNCVSDCGNHIVDNRYYN